MKQGLLGAESKALQGIVMKYAGTKNLTRFTMFQSANLQTVWHFKGFDIAGTKTTPMVIPTLPDKTTDETFFAGFGASFAGGFTPETTATDSMQLLGNTTKAKAATKVEQSAAVDAAFKVENPDFHSPNTIDCASCHLAGPALARTAHGDLGLDVGTNANAFQPDASWVSAADTKQTTPIAGSGTLNVHVFSYRAGELMIASRVINETASVVAYANTALAR